MDNNQYNQYNQYQNQSVTPQGDIPASGNGFATASLVLAIISVISSCCFYLSIPLAALSILFALLSKRGEMHLRGRAMTGMITGIVGLVISALLVIMAVASLFVYGTDSVRDQMKGYMEYYYGDTYDSHEMDDLLDEFLGPKDSQGSDSQRPDSNIPHDNSHGTTL